MSDNLLEVFEGDPVEKWGDVILHASQKPVRAELERLLELQALSAFLLEEVGLEERLEDLLKQCKFDQALQARVQAKKIDLVMTSMANILGHE
ncbi:DUF2018 family protein [Helicobacter baculiformis]|uniref:DUF2018 family protein n=1 Tax=Helicobacter baculiformis TaxID=427351 RepID=A0ABV7ZEY0_9HELI|nr:DUF2018 family protein [Helicobacter baculiformis]